MNFPSSNASGSVGMQNAISEPGSVLLELCDGRMLPIHLERAAFFGCVLGELSCAALLERRRIIIPFPSNRFQKINDLFWRLWILAAQSSTNQNALD